MQCAAPTYYRCSLRRVMSRFRSLSSSEKEPIVLWSVDDAGICTVTLNRPHKLNALNLAMFRELRNVQRQILSDKQIRVVLLTGAGRAFCSGLDVPSIVRDQYAPIQNTNALLERAPLSLPVVEENTETENTVDSDDSLDAARMAVAATSNLAQDVAYLWRQMPVPVIACIHGVCLGGGLQIALGADVRLIERSDTTQCSILETKWGLIPDMTASITLRELVRIDVAKEWTWTGRHLSAEEAVAGGLATRCVEAPVLAAGRALAEALVQKSPAALQYAKQLYQATWRTGVSEEYCLQLETQYQRKLLGSYNQIAAALRNFGWQLPYFRRRE